ncbi:MAG: hypothetical protein WCG73_03560 [Candidatus Moraniibacteriota bacterium]
MKADRDIKKLFPLIPDVMDDKSFWEFIKKSNPEMGGIGFSIASIPPSHIICPVCEKPWTIEDCSDFTEYSGTEEEKVISLKDFVGKTLYEVQMAFNEKTDAIYRINQPELMIRNDRFIDLTPDPDYADHNKEYPDHMFLMNKRGWVGEKNGIDGDYLVQEGDDGYFNIWRYYHKTCNRKKINEDQLAQYERIFEKAGFKELDVRLLATPNQYCSNGPDCCPSWYNVNTIYGTGILIGWRKRVINIDWSQWGYDLSYLFPNEDVTKWEGGIHAWGEEKAIEYLSKIAAEVKNSKKIQNKIMTYRSTHERDLYNN